MALPSNIIEIQDGEQLLKIRIQKMDVLAAEDFLERMLAVLIKSGFKLPARLIGGDPSALGKEIAKNTEGFLVQLKDLQFEEVAYLRDRIFKNCYIQRTDEKSGKEIEIVMSDQNVRANVFEVSTIFKIRLEVLRYNFAFLANALEQVGKLARETSSTPNTQMCPPL